MADTAENQPSEKPHLDLRIQTEDIAFKPDEMQPCTACKRLNPPTRLNCLYCGNQLEIRPENASLIKPGLRRLEAWERGFNVILREPLAADQVNPGKIAAFLSMEPDTLRVILDTAACLPLARVETETEADIIVTGLANVGLTCSILADADIADDKLPVRISSIELNDGSISVTDFNTRKVTVVANGDLALIIPGMLTTGRVDLIEKKKRGGASKLIDETTTSADESILDLYSRQDAIGFRVHLTGFDFSCLGTDKGLIAVENIRRLAAALQEQAPDAKLAADYTNVRPALGHVWEIESRKDALGLQRAGFGKKEFGSVASTSNLRQFTKYSRLQWHLL